MTVVPPGDTSGMRAMWNHTVIAETDDTVLVEGHHYFAAGSLRGQFFRASRRHSICGWKGRASYYTVEVDGEVAPDAAWFYPHPLPFARRVKNRVAFGRGVVVVT